MTPRSLLLCFGAAILVGLSALSLTAGIDTQQVSKPPDAAQHVSKPPDAAHVATERVLEDFGPAPGGSAGQQAGETACGDGICDAGENPCTCSADCGRPIFESRCSDGIDNDCDGLIDCSDPECISAPDCDAPSCVPKRGACSEDVECCSEKCRRGRCRG